MRSTVDLIQELQKQSPHFNTVSLVVGFDKTTEFVSGSDPDALQKLNTLVSAGGEPIALFGVHIDEAEKRLSVHTKVLAEYENETWVDGYLNQLVTNFVELGKQDGLFPSEWKYVKESSWVQ